MILCVDCGNTSIKFALFEKGHLVKSYLLRTLREKSSDEYALSFSSIIGKDVSVEGAIISSVVPFLTPVLFNALNKAFNITPLILGKHLKTKLALKIDNPSELGSDIIAGALGAKEKYGDSTLVADLGTATKIYVIDQKGAFIGVAIAAGMEISLKTLVSSTSQLLETAFVTPQKIIGKNTKDAIQSGIVYGQAFMIERFAEKMEDECGYKLKRVVTGGYSRVVKDELNGFIFNEDLVLEGLYHIYEINGGVKND